MLKFIAAIVAMGVPLVATNSAFAGDSDKGRTELSAVIPEFCQLDARTFVVDPDSLILTGFMYEACNTNRGFQVLATHRALVPGERIQVRFGADSAELSPGGISFVALRSGARVNSVPVRIEADDLQQPIALSFSLTAV